jgi:hypothetical protein
VSLVGAFRTVGEPIADLLGPMPYQAIQTLIDPLWEKGIHAYFKATNLAGPDDELTTGLRAPPRGSGPQCESTCTRWAARAASPRCDGIHGAVDAVLLNAVTGVIRPTRNRTRNGPAT